MENEAEREWVLIHELLRRGKSRITSWLVRHVCVLNSKKEEEFIRFPVRSIAPSWADAPRSHGAGRQKLHSCNVTLPGDSSPFAAEILTENSHFIQNSWFELGLAAWKSCSSRYLAHQVFPRCSYYLHILRRTFDLLGTVKWTWRFFQWTWDVDVMVLLWFKTSSREVVVLRVSMIHVYGKENFRLSSNNYEAII